MGCDKNLSDICRTWFVSRSANLTQLVGLKLCHGLGKALFSCLKKIYVEVKFVWASAGQNFFVTSHEKMSRNLCHKSSPIPLWNLTDSQIVTNGSWQKPIRTLSDLKIVTNGAWQKTYPNSVGLENCHKCGITKHLSEIFRTWKLSQKLFNPTLCHE